MLTEDIFFDMEFLAFYTGNNDLFEKLWDDIPENFTSKVEVHKYIAGHYVGLREYDTALELLSPFVDSGEADLRCFAMLIIAANQLSDNNTVNTFERRASELGFNGLELGNLIGELEDDYNIENKRCKVDQNLTPVSERSRSESRSSSSSPNNSRSESKGSRSFSM